MGVESFSQSQLDRWRKSTTVTVNQEAVQALSEANCSYYPYLILSDQRTTAQEVVENCDGIVGLPPSRYELKDGDMKIDARLSPVHWGLHLNRYKTFLGDVERAADTEYLEAMWAFIQLTQHEADRLCGLYRHSLAAPSGGEAGTAFEGRAPAILDDRIRAISSLVTEIARQDRNQGMARAKDLATAFNQSALLTNVEYMSRCLSESLSSSAKASYEVV